MKTSKMFVAEMMIKEMANFPSFLFYDLVA